MILDINKRLTDKKEMDKIGTEYKDGVVLVDGDNFKTLFGKKVYPVAMMANMELRKGQSTFKLACGGYVNLSDEEWKGEWYDRLMPPPKDYKEPTLSDIAGAPASAYQMLSKEPDLCKK